VDEFNGTLDPQFNDHAFQLQHQFDTEQQQKIQWGREAETYARSSQIQTMELSSLKAKQAAQSIIGSAMAGGLNGTQLTASLIRNRASLDTEAFNDAMQFAKAIPSDEAYVTQTHAGDHLIELNAFLQHVAQTRSQMQASGQPVINDDQWTTRVAQTQFKFFNALRTGADPDDALRSAILSTGVASSVAQTWVNRATSKHIAPNLKDLTRPSQ
jgi:hypothetical protein